MTGRDERTRREILMLLGGTAMLAPRAVGAQEPGRVYRLGNLHQALRDAPHHLALYHPSAVLARADRVVE
jgi:hypothetical protein